jgi:hypothetical protein
MLDNGAPDHNDCTEAQLIFDRAWAAVKKHGKADYFEFPVYGSIERELIDKLSSEHVDAIQEHWDTVAHTKKKEWTKLVYDTWWDITCPVYPDNTYQPVMGEDDERITRRVNKWTETRDPSRMFSNTESRMALLAVKEFVANSEGKTYYPRCYGMPLVGNIEFVEERTVTPSNAETQYVWVIQRNADMQECRGSWILDSVWADSDDVIQYFESQEGVMGSSVKWSTHLDNCVTSNGWMATRMELSVDASRAFQKHQERLCESALEKLSYDEFIALGLEDMFPDYWEK